MEKPSIALCDIILLSPNNFLAVKCAFTICRLVVLYMLMNSFCAFESQHVWLNILIVQCITEKKHFFSCYCISFTTEKKTSTVSLTVCYIPRHIFQILMEAMKWYFPEDMLPLPIKIVDAFLLLINIKQYERRVFLFEIIGS